MSSLIDVIIYSLVGGVFSLIGGFLLLMSKQRAKKYALYVTPFAAGALLAAAFNDLLSESIHLGSTETALQYTLIGILGFFLLEGVLRHYHHHNHDGKGHKDPAVPMIIIGDTLHNFIDGIAIAAGFLISPGTGAVVTLAVAAHEIPQEIGDMGLLLKKGMARKKVLLVNLISAFATTASAVIFFQIGQTDEINLGIALGLVAGFFIYIAVSDIIPAIHENKDKAAVVTQTAILLAGVVLVSIVTNELHEYIDRGHDHEHSQLEGHDHYEKEHSSHDDHSEEDHKDSNHSDEAHHSEEEHSDSE